MTFHLFKVQPQSSRKDPILRQMIQHKRLTPLLKSKHFIGLDLQMTNQGLSYEVQIDTEDRRNEIFEISDGERDIDEALTRIESHRPFTQIIVNPQSHTTSELQKYFAYAQESVDPSQRVSIKHGLPDEYVHAWAIEKNPDGALVESQRLVIVAFHKNEPVGFAGISLSLNYEAPITGVYFNQGIDLVFVHPKERGKGFGLDLSIGCSKLCQDLLDAVYRAVPARCQISLGMNADFTSLGGERFTRQLADGLNFKVDMLRDFGRRRTVKIDSLELDAGF